MNIQEKLKFDRDALEHSKAHWLIGIDEVGWGSFAGDIVIGAVAIPLDIYQAAKGVVDHPLLSKVHDSKKVKPELREKISAQIKQSHCYGFGHGKVASINEESPNEAYKQAFHAAISDVYGKMPPNKNSYHVLLDGSREVDSPIPQQLVTKGDEKSYVIAAASIIAKVYRDNLMTELSKKYPHYDWENNAGYGSPKHREALRKHGACPEHRTQYIRSTIISG